ncbi:hypothetical protein I5G58_gp076 [Mycobacterium phage BirdsNest]|uniref:Uncharacterized protein n=1 Tax=Mycobacterium phage BirdsNest TaxID=2686231 RepID=A0A6B9LCX1_9CAUD|nr:hypothetical protein I5G58_gp076 [Mycobacterium phage BirdsNest]QHB37378.1 hypothetical protein PBI_BIRDSNEST_76 [Mycobacterium phage BirdsNest]
MTGDPTMWVAVRIGRGKKPYAVRLGESGPFAVGRPGPWRPNGAVITFASLINAEARAAKLNLADREARRKAQAGLTRRLPEVAG